MVLLLGSWGRRWAGDGRGKHFANWQVLTTRCDLALPAALTSLPHDLPPPCPPQVFASQSCRLLPEPSLTAALSCAPQVPSVLAVLTSFSSVSDAVC